MDETRVSPRTVVPSSQPPFELVQPGKESFNLQCDLCRRNARPV